MPLPWLSCWTRPPPPGWRRACWSSSPGSPSCCSGGQGGSRLSRQYFLTPTPMSCRRSRTSGTPRPSPPPWTRHPVASTREVPRT
uniref:Uncharacterized protein n=1 Tax=Arundo donax TaxID=35708 RepID=A0A0A9D6B7_ARUDO